MVKDYIRVGGNDYLMYASIGKVHDPDWDDRHSVQFRIEMTHAQALETFVDGLEWSSYSVETDDEDESIPAVYHEYDNSQFNVAGDIIDHRDGTVSIKMGETTDLEEAYELLYGGE